MGAFSIWHWLVVLAVVLVVFGGKKIRSLGGDLGAGIRSFKDGLKGAEDGQAAPGSPADAARVTASLPAGQQPAATTIDVEVKTKN